MELSSEENQLKLVAQRSAKNISAIIKDLFHSPPSYKTKIIVSWRPLNDKVINIFYQFRRIPILSHKIAQIH